ncbi:serine/threonine-protein kinase Nek4-like isoform X1 [Argonauta hians]
MALQKAGKPKTLRGFELSRVIGKGSYGEVWLARHIKDRRPYVLKKINLKSTSDKERKAAEQEARLLSNLRHPNIVTYKDSFQAGERYLYIAMQYCEGGDLYTWLKDRKGKILEEKQVVEWFIQIAMALQYLHDRDILHRDLKTQNIFLTKNKIIKVGDLGIARVLENSSDMATTLIGTPYYMSPELFSSKPYNQKSDVWALGCCVYEMTTLRHAFNARDMNSLAFKILSGKLPPMPQVYSSELVHLIQNMLHQDPSRRPSVGRLLRMSYVKKNITLFLEETRKGRRPLPSTPTTAASPSSSSPSSSHPARPHLHKPRSQPPPSSSSSPSSAAAASAAKKDYVDGPRPSNSSLVRLEPVEDLSPASPTPVDSSPGPMGSDSPPPSPAVGENSPSSPVVTIINSSLSPGGPVVAFNSRPTPVAVAVASGSPSPSAECSPNPRPVAAAATTAAAAADDGDGDDDDSSHYYYPSPHSPAMPVPKNSFGRGANGNSADGETPRQPDTDADADAGTVSDTGPAETGPEMAQRGRGVALRANSICEEQASVSPASSVISSSSSTQSSLNEAPSPSSALEGNESDTGTGTPTDTIKNTVIQQHAMDGEVAMKNQDIARRRSSSSDIPNGNTDSTLKKYRVDKSRPLPPPPVIDAGNGVPQNANSRVPRLSSSSSSSKECSSNLGEGDAPRSLPNVLARQKRRQKQSLSCSLEKQEGRVKLRQPSHLRKSHEKPSEVVSPLKGVRSQRQYRQPSMSTEDDEDEGNSSPEDDINKKKRDKIREDRDMENLAMVLNTTLQTNLSKSIDDKSDEECKSVSRSPQKRTTRDRSKEEEEEEQEEINDLPSADTLVQTKRLSDRITILEKNCVSGVGREVLQEAINILDRFEEEDIKPRLEELLGEDNFHQYAGKIWQLKYCKQMARN